MSNPFEPAPQIHFIPMARAADGTLHNLDRWPEECWIAPDTLTTILANSWATLDGGTLPITTSNAGAATYRIEDLPKPGYFHHAIRTTS